MTYFNRLLLWTQKITGLDVVYFARGSFWLSIAQFFSIISSLAVSIIFANKLDPEIYGQYRYLMSLVGIIGTLSLTGLGTALSQAIARGKEKTLLSAFRTQVIWSIPVTILGLVLGSIAFSRGNVTYGWALCLYFLTFSLTNATGLYDNFLTGRGSFSRSARYYLLSSVAINILLAASAYFLPKQFLFLFPASFVLQFFFNLVFFGRVRSEINPGSSVDTNTANYGKNLSLANIMTAIADQIDSLVLFWIAGPQILAVYSFAIAGPEIAKGFLKLIMPLSLPKFSVTNWQDIRTNLPRHMAKFFLLTIVIVTVYFFFAPILFQLLFPKYHQSVLLSQIFSLSLLFAPVYLLLSAVQAQKKVRELYFYNIFSPIATILLTVSLTYFYGIWGLIAARIAGRAFGFTLLSFLTFQKRGSS